MRALALEWLIDVHYKFKLLPETLFLTVNYMDRFLSTNNISKKDLQLVAICALQIASKYEDIYPPERADFEYVCDNAYSKDQIILCEKAIWAGLNFEMSPHTSNRCLERFCQIMGSDDLVKSYAQYLIECCLVEYSLIKWKPSLVAASCLYLAKKILKYSEPWSKTIQDETGFTT